MSNHYEIEALKAKLATAETKIATAESELASMRAQRNKIDVRAEVERRGGSDHETIAKRLDKYVRILDDGMRVAVDEYGEFRFGNGRGSYMEVPEFLDELARNEPELFSGKAQGNAKDHVGPNPFAKGSINVTQQMLIYRQSPELAEHLEYLAATGKN